MAASHLNTRKILPCPFCHSPRWGILQTHDQQIYNVMCLSCYASGPDAKTIKHAKTLWNIRNSENPFSEKL